MAEPTVHSLADGGRAASNRQGKTALVLAGGGITGIFYELGALRAIEKLLVDYSVNDFDIYVGTSAGAWVCALMVNGFSPHASIQTFDQGHPDLRGLRVGDIVEFDLDGMAQRLFALPRALCQFGWRTLSRRHEMAVSSMIWELLSLLHDGATIEKHVRAVLEQPGRTNRFSALEKALYIVATELDSGRRAVFAAGDATGEALMGPFIRNASISQAVAASSAIPLLYRPIQIGGRDYVDGGLHGAASLDLAIEAGAKLIVCINPMAPLNATEGRRSVRKWGFQTIVNQTVRTLLHSTVRYHVKNLRAKHPDVDIILIQPRPDDVEMFSFGLMDYRNRLAVAEHGFETMAHGLLSNFDNFETVLARHDIRIVRRTWTCGETIYSA